MQHHLYLGKCKLKSQVEFWEPPSPMLFKGQPKTLSLCYDANQIFDLSHLQVQIFAEYLCIDGFTFIVLHNVS